MGYKKIIVFDFDGVIHSYTSGWQGCDVCNDEPVKGIKELIDTLKSDFQIYVVSSRCSMVAGIVAIEEYMEKHKIHFDKVQWGKPPAYLTIDDRAIQFKGTENLLDNVDIWGFEPWKA